MATTHHHHHNHTGREGCTPGCRKRHVRTEGSDNITTSRGSSVMKAAGMAALIFSAVAHSASAATTVSGSSPSISSYGVVPSDSKQKASGGFMMMPSVLSSLWGHQVDVDVETPSVANRLLQDDHDDHDHDEDHATESAAAVEEDHLHTEDEHLDEHTGDENHANESGHNHDEDEHLHADAEGEDGDHDDHDHEKDEHLHAEGEVDDHDGHMHGDEFDDRSTSTVANESKAGGDPWGAVIGATLLVNVATFSGVLILALPAMYRGVLKYRNIPVESSPAAHGSGRIFDIFIPGFAVGALMATAVFLVLPESLKYISGEGHESHAEDVHDDHSDHGHRYLQEDVHAGEGSTAAKFGCSVLGGFLLPFVLAIIFHHSEPTEDEVIQARTDNSAVLHEEEDCETCNDKADLETGVVATVRVDDPQDSTSGSPIIQKIEDATPEEMCKCDVCEEEGSNNETELETIITQSSFVNKRLCASILLGDSFHNFADGFFIAAAFRSCSVGVAISIMLVTLFHEIAQELADYIVLTKYGGLSVWKALTFNFLSGLSVCLGGVIFLAANPSDVATGIILAMAGGVYINIAACETAPRMEAAMKVRGDRVLMLFSIILGTIPLGLILLDHKHCD